MNAPEQAKEIEPLAQVISSLNDELEVSANASANRAFNLGCLVGMLPAAVLIILTYYLTGHSWVGAVVILILSMLGLILFANLAASVSRQNTIKRIYREKTNPKIEKTLQDYGIDRTIFDLEASRLLSTGSTLREFVTDVPDSEMNQNGTHQ